MIKQLLRSRALMGILCVLLSGCSADKQPSQLETVLANLAKDVVIPIQAQTLENPVPASEQVIQQGQQIFGQACSICHGADGHARTGLGRAMYPPAMDLTSPHVKSWTDAELFWIIQNGIRLTGSGGSRSHLVKDCLARLNVGVGIEVGGAATVSGNSVESNSSDGIIVATDEKCG